MKELFNCDHKETGERSPILEYISGNVSGEGQIGPPCQWWTIHHCWWGRQQWSNPQLCRSLLRGLLVGRLQHACSHQRVTNCSDAFFKRNRTQIYIIICDFGMCSACFVRVDESHLLMLGGDANPKGKVEYNIASDTWATLPDLPFGLQNGACLTVDMPGVHVLL